MSRHPLLQEERPYVATPAMLAFFGAILVSLENAFRGIAMYSFARFGKTTAITYAHKTREWLKGRLAASVLIDAPDGDTRNDNTFYAYLLTELGVQAPSQPQPGQLLDMVVAKLIQLCNNAKSRLIMVYIDEAQGLKHSDYTKLVHIDNKMTRRRYRLFVVFVYQRDITGYTNEASNHTSLPPHVVGRFLVHTHDMLGVKDVAEAAYIMDRYDHSTEWPSGSGITHIQHFVEPAFQRGWRLSHAADQLWRVASLRRSEARLPENWTWPMKSFEGTLVYLVTTIAPRYAEHFQGFSDKDIDEALKASAFIQLELSRSTYLPVTKK